MGASALCSVRCKWAGRANTFTRNLNGAEWKQLRTETQSQYILLSLYIIIYPHPRTFVLDLRWWRRYCERIKWFTIYICTAAAVFEPVRTTNLYNIMLYDIMRTRRQHETTVFTLCIFSEKCSEYPIGARLVKLRNFEKRISL